MLCLFLLNSLTCDTKHRPGLNKSHYFSGPKVIYSSTLVRSRPCSYLSGFSTCCKGTQGFHNITFTYLQATQWDPIMKHQCGRFYVPGRPRNITGLLRLINVDPAFWSSPWTLAYTFHVIQLSSAGKIERSRAQILKSY